MDFTDLDYSKLFLNPMSLGGKKPQQVYATWNDYPEFHKHVGVNKDRLFKYIPLAYGEKSPLHKHLPNIKKVKGAAAELAGFERNGKGMFEKGIEEIISCQNATVNAMIIRYITLHRNSLYHEIAVLKEAHFKLSTMVIQDPETKALKDFKNTSREIDESTQELLMKDELLVEDFTQYYLEDKIKLRPEDIAIARTLGTEPLE